MFGRKGVMLVLGLAVLVAALGLGRLRFDPDVLGMLSPEMPEVQGLKAYQEGFAREDELVILLEGTEQDEGLLSDAAESLAAALREAGVAREVQWQPQWTQDPAGLAELIAYLWLNGPPQEVARQLARLSPENSAETLAAALRRVATAREGEDLALRAHDPFGFLDHPSLEPLLGAAEGGAGGFESEDGLAHLLLVTAPAPIHGYREAEVWLDKVREVIAAWQEKEGEGLLVRLTGEPAFSSEIGGAMENDMRGTVGASALLIGALFWLMQRRLSLLAGLLGILGLVFATALGLAGWIYGELSIMAAGFAAILIGLAVDYGVLICQEAKVSGHDPRKLARATTRSIVWAALTTAVVFFALNRSGLPGIAQLGTMVGCGIVAGAVLMLGCYLPFVSKMGASRPAVGGKALQPPFRASVALALLLGLAGGATLIGKGFPKIGFDPQMMRPRDSAAMAGFDRVQEKFPQWNADGLRVVVEAADEAVMHARLAEAQQRLEARRDLIEKVALPLGWWPFTQQQAENRVALRELSGAMPRLLSAADEAGFSEEGVALGKSVLESLAQMSGGETAALPSSPAALEMMRLFISMREDGSGRVAGAVHLADKVDPAGADYAELRGISGDGIWLTGWSLLRPAVMPMVKRDIFQVFLPMAGLMVAMLILMFRSAREVLLILASMALSGLVLLAVMRCLGIGWNFLNIAACPLLLGTGIDYGIHVMMTLRRNGGDVAAMWHGTGKAVVFCACSTAIGFGSLCFASNEAMASLGAVAVIGILASMGVSVFLLPGWRGASAR
jgi:uncharacterized protein